MAQDEQQLMWAALLTAAIPGLWGAGRTGYALGVLAGVCLCVELDHWSSRTVRLHSTGFLFARSICGWHAAAIEMWRHRDGGRGLLLVQSVDKAALWRICIFKLGFWTTEKPDLIKEHLKRYKGISRNDTYCFSLEQNLSLSLCWLHTSSVELVGFCKAGFKLALW